MKRSEIDGILRDMERMIDRCPSKLPPFCCFILEEWKEKGREYDEVRDNMPGWDITDFGMGDFDKVGFSLITPRNGNASMDKYTKLYAEKLLYMKGGQSAAMYLHRNKMEGIIDRGGGNMLIGVYNAGKKEGLADADVLIHSDRREYTIPAGVQIRLYPGESITIQPRLYHGLHLGPGTGPILLGGVSVRNSDNRDNRFYLPAGRLPVIEKDEPPFRLLCNGHPPADSCAER